MIFIVSVLVIYFLLCIYIKNIILLEQKSSERQMNILITIAYLDGWSGAPIQIYEYCQYLSKTNQVTVLCINASAEFKNLFTKINVNIFEITKDTYPLEYDFVYSFHFPIFSYLIEKGLSTKKWVAGSLSPVTKLESFPSYWEKANFLTVHSGRSIELNNMHFGIPTNSMKLFGNPIPDEYANYNHHKNGFPKIPSKIGIVSNHIPNELLKIKKYLPKKIKIDFIGYHKKYIKITPQILSTYDLIITIGKTVQYSLGLGIPIYEYDIFGGCGYITPQNYEPEKFRNFCGLATERKLNTKSIANEILQGYESAVQNIDNLKSLALNDFLLSKLMKNFMDLVIAAPEINLSKEKLKDYSLELNHDTETFNLMYLLNKRFLNRLIDFIRKKIHGRKNK